MDKAVKRKKHRGRKILKVFSVSVAALIILGISGYFYIAFHPQVIVGLIQSVLYPDGKEINPADPQNTPDRKIRDNGILYVNDIKYGETYPNSFLDISYPPGDAAAGRPTVIYFHGGGFFGGDKVMGDPLAVNDDSTYLFDKLVSEGFNFVNVNYVLVPEYHFPDPLIQMNEAVNYLVSHQGELGLDMDDVVIFGQSAGAGLTAQYGAVLSNPDYRDLFQFTEEPELKLEDIRALVIDDVPLDISDLKGLAIKILSASYLDDSIFFKNRELADQYSVIHYMNGSFPRKIRTYQARLFV